MQGAACAECGGVRGALGDCAAVFEAQQLSELEQPAMYAWHAVTVSAYLLQHPSQIPDGYRDVQFRILQLYRDRGVDGLQGFVRHQRARNNHRNIRGYDLEPLAPYSELPPRPAPTMFDSTIQDLPGDDQTFTGDGVEQYARRLDGMIDATIRAWLRA